MDTLKLAALLVCVATVNGNTRTESSEDDVIISTTHGDVRGLRKTVAGREVDVYWGIPYAKFPARFQRSETADRWKGVLEATTPPPTCPGKAYGEPIPLLLDTTTPVDEKCLYLNLWVPRGCEGGEGLALMVWIHGGALEWGSSTVPTYNGQVLAATQCVIVASLNYRLGPSGFLSVGDDSAPGNVGLLDQVLALQWIHDNAVNFGGLPSEVTVFGESAGALSVGVHMVSPLSRHLFRRAVMMSGPVLASWGKTTLEENKRMAKQLASLLGCPREGEKDEEKEEEEEEEEENKVDEAMVACLSRVDIADLTTAVQNLQKPNQPTFGVIVDGRLLQEPLENSYTREENDVKQFDVMMGATKDDAAFILPMMFSPEHADPDSKPAMSSHVFHQLLQDVVFKHMIPSPRDHQVASRLVEYIYINSSLPAVRADYYTAMESVLRDLNFICRMYTTVAPFVGRSRVYLYSYDHRSSVTPFPRWAGVVHASELDLVFGRPWDNSTWFTEEERTLSELLMTAWANFAKFGNPNGEHGDLPVMWSALYRDTGTYPYVSFNTPPNQMDAKEGLQYPQCQFWNHVYPTLVAGEERGGGGGGGVKGHDEL